MLVDRAAEAGRRRRVAGAARRRRSRHRRTAARGGGALAEARSTPRSAGTTRSRGAATPARTACSRRRASSPAASCSCSRSATARCRSRIASAVSSTPSKTARPASSSSALTPDGDRGGRRSRRRDVREARRAGGAARAARTRRLLGAAGRRVGARARRRRARSREADLKRVTLAIGPGSALPLGATWDGDGVAFALFSEHASGVELCLFDAAGSARDGAHRAARAQRRRLPRPRRRPASRPALRLPRPGSLRAATRAIASIPHKLLVDPYARAIAGTLRFDAALRGGDAAQPDPRDSAPFVPKSVVVDPHFDWEDDRPPRTPWSRSVFYECHVKGMTQRHPQLARRERGRFDGLAAEPVIAHLQRLGVTALSRCCRSSTRASTRTSPGSACPTTGATTRSASSRRTRASPTGDRGEQVVACKRMVKALHRAGHRGDPRRRLQPHARGRPRRADALAARHRQRVLLPAAREDPSRVHSTTAAAATRWTRRHPRALQLVLDSLRLWVTEYHVDGFRFDLAPVLARDPVAFQRSRPLLRDRPPGPGARPAEVDRGALGPRAGRLSAGRVSVRLRGVERALSRRRPALLARRRRASSPRRRRGSPARATSSRSPAARPQASVNYFACHDGMTLTDLVTYSREAQRRERRRGSRRAAATIPTTGASKGRPATRSSSRCARARCATCSPRSRSRRAFRCSSHGDELGPHPARQQQRVLPGQRSHLGRLEPRRRGAGAARVHAQRARAAPRQRGVPPSLVLPRRVGRSRRGWTTSPGCSRDGRSRRTRNGAIPSAGSLGMLIPAEGRRSERRDGTRAAGRDGAGAAQRASRGGHLHAARARALRHLARDPEHRVRRAARVTGGERGRRAIRCVLLAFRDRA